MSHIYLQIHSVVDNTVQLISALSWSFEFQLFHCKKKKIISCVLKLCTLI